ncbi:valine N-monooxygenase 2-like [Impatiens glandulifera]|uniref:valine N-monooxygenase 2-like n=1 Tax=Impatiens glandulifera TaxID=253017 RepID=UPI001FB10BC2|nr:valine N-monooxygenase 2-like [Impatiens glandulifera]
MSVEICCFRLWKTNVIVVSSPEVACEFLRKHDAVFASRPDFLSAELVGGGFSGIALTPLCDQWKKMRHIFVARIFSSTSLQLMHDKRVEEFDNIVHYVGNVIKNNEGLVNVRLVARHFCANVMRKMVFNKRFFGKGTLGGGPGVEEEEHVDMIFTMQKYVYSFCISDYVPFLRRRLDLDGHEKATRHALENVRKYQDPEIDLRIKQWKDGTRSEKQDLLDILITLEDDKCNSLLTTEEIKSQVMDIMLTIDNPSNLVEWAMGELINQPELLKIATQELDRVVGKKRLVQESDIPNLNYTKACLKESLRLHPVAPFNLPHVSVSDTVVAGYFIPKGSHVLLSRPGLGQNPRIWDEPLRFKPERHLKDDGSQVNLYDPNLHVFSFGIGRRADVNVLEYTWDP